MNLAQFCRQTVLQIVEKLLYTSDANARQMTEPHLFHVKDENDARPWTVSIQACVNGHEKRFDSLVNDVIGRF